MFLLKGGPWRTEKGTTTLFLARKVARGRGKVGKNGEGAKPHHWMVLGGAEVVRSGGSTERGGRRQVCSCAVVLWRWKEGAAGLGRFTGSRAIRSGGWFGEREWPEKGAPRRAELGSHGNGGWGALDARRGLGVVL